MKKTILIFMAIFLSGNLIAQNKNPKTFEEAQSNYFEEIQKIDNEILKLSEDKMKLLDNYIEQSNTIREEQLKKVKEETDESLANLPQNEILKPKKKK